jgi:nitrous oxidase accessory protein NosD
VSIVASDLVLFHAATQSDVDGSTVGGAIDLLRRPDFTQATAADTVEVISSSASDTQNCTIEARKADGTVVSETLVLTGTTAKVFSGNGAIDRILKVELASVAIGTVTVRKNSAGATYRTIPIGERGFSAVMRKGSSSTSGIINYYAKTFWKNTNGSFALLAATVTESADPSATITHGLATAVNDSGTTTNRQTAPGSVTFAGTAAAVPGTDLASGAAIGLWLNMTLATNNAPIRSTYTSQLAGSTT